jgi:hypothetical protein
MAGNGGYGSAQQESAGDRHWRWGITRPIALLREEPDELERLGVRFEADADDLDELRHARVQTPAGRVYALVRYRRSPQPGTEVVTQEDSNNPLRDLEDVLRVLKLTAKDITWEHPLIATIRIAERLKKRLRRLFWSVGLIVAAIQSATLWLMMRSYVTAQSRSYEGAVVLQVLAVIVALLGASLGTSLAERSFQSLTRADSGIPGRGVGWKASRR